MAMTAKEREELYAILDAYEAQEYYSAVTSQY